MNRDKLGAQADAHLREQEVRLRQAFENGRRFERARIGRVEWRKLFGMIVAGSVIGCGYSRYSGRVVPHRIRRAPQTIRWIPCRRCKRDCARRRSANAPLCEACRTGNYKKNK
jgi:hypothetical protein